MLSNRKKVILAMSGGVDSSVAAYLLKKNKNYLLEAVFMKNWEEDDTKTFCAASVDLADARSVCKQLNIKLHTVNFSFEYWENVFKEFLSEYRKGRTPNPDVSCNREIKFKLLLEFATKNLHADYMATGHYVRARSSNGLLHLLRGVDSSKDQSYFLYTLKPEQIAKTLFPIGVFKKNQVRKIASELNLVTAKKKDSVGICFIGKNKFRPFLKRYISEIPGKIITPEKKEVGSHLGLAYYTIGQRKGLNIGGLKKGKNEPWYVVAKDVKKNLLIVDQGKENTHLASKNFTANKVNWINGISTLLPKKFFCSVKTRYRQVDVPCKVTQSFNKKDILVNLKEPIFAVAPGQSAVFYDGEICLGGGIINTSF